VGAEVWRVFENAGIGVDVLDCWWS
jgi:hypothetical protein